jgi:hypothetical protein
MAKIEWNKLQGRDPFFAIHESNNFSFQDRIRNRAARLVELPDA